MANRNFARVMRRKTQWGGMGDAQFAAAIPLMQSVAPGATEIISGGIIIAGSAGLVEEEVTLTRTIGRVSVSLDDSVGAGISGSVAVGLGVFTFEAVSGGVATLPSPQLRPDFEWLYYSVVQLYQVGAQDTGGNSESTQFNFDVRGQRVIRTGQTVVWLAEAVNVAMRIGVGGRYLVKLT